jgi:hypothetical protein
MIALLFGELSAIDNTAYAQGLTTSPYGDVGRRPVVGSTGGLGVNKPPSPYQDQGSATAGRVHLDPVGKPCLAVTGVARLQPARLDPRSQTLDPKKQTLDANGQPADPNDPGVQPQPSGPKIFEHSIVARNNCSTLIKLKVCYYHTQSCVPIEVPAYGRKDALLGIYPSLKDFRYEYVEQFSEMDKLTNRPLR